MSDTASHSLDGVWQLLRAEFGGETAPDLVTERTVLHLTAGEYEIRFDGRTTDRGTFELGGAIDAHTLTLHGKKGTNAGRTIPCIYQLRGDRLRVCYGLNGIAPTEYTTDPNRERYLGTYRRIG